jgi:hypothetical protein
MFITCLTTIFAHFLPVSGHFLRISAHFLTLSGQFPHLPLSATFWALSANICALSAIVYTVSATIFEYMRTSCLFLGTFCQYLRTFSYLLHCFCHFTQSQLYWVGLGSRNKGSTTLHILITKLILMLFGGNVYVQHNSPGNNPLVPRSVPCNYWNTIRGPRVCIHIFVGVQALTLPKNRQFLILLWVPPPPQLRRIKKNLSHPESRHRLPSHPYLYIILPIPNCNGLGLAQGLCLK